MREYEVVYIFRTSLEPDEIDERLEGHHDRLDGEITAVEHWGKRQLAYQIEKQGAGYYVVAQFRADPASLPGFEQALRHDEDVLRHLVVLSEGELPTPPSQRGEEPEEEEEEADEEEDGDEEESGEPDEEDEEAPDEDDEEADEDASSDEEEEK